MQPTELNHILHQKPFHPFRVYLADGRSYEVRYPHFTVVGKTFMHIGFPCSGDNGKFICGARVFIDPAAVQRLEFLEGEDKAISTLEYEASRRAV